MTNSYPEAYQQYLASSKAAVEFHDANWTHTAIMKERAKRLKAARDMLRAVVPESAGNPDANGDPRGEVFEKLLLTDADTVAVAANEWAKVEKLLDAGRDLGQIIKNASRARLAAILDQFPTSQVALSTTDPEAVISEVQGLAFDRLVGLGDIGAVAADKTIREAQRVGAWHAVIGQAVHGEVAVSAWSDLHRVAPDEYDAANSRDDQESVDMAAKTKAVDALGLTE